MAKIAASAWRSWRRRSVGLLLSAGSIAHALQPLVDVGALAGAVTVVDRGSTGR